MIDFISLIEKTKPSEIGVSDLYPEFQKTLAFEDKALKVDFGSVKTEHIKELDLLRDKTWNSINQRVNATVISPIEAEAKAAAVLKRVVNLYGDQRQASYNIESAAIANMVSDLLSATNKVHVEKIGITITASKDRRRMTT